MGLENYACVMPNCPGRVDREEGICGKHTHAERLEYHMNRTKPIPAKTVKGRQRKKKKEPPAAMPTPDMAKQTEADKATA